jgi:hypothetical protein
MSSLEMFYSEMLANTETFYLEVLANIETPALSGGFGVEENHQIYHDYCQLRNSAKDLLSNPQDTEARRKLSELIKKLSININ